MPNAGISIAIEQFGMAAKAKLAGVGEPEEALRAPIEKLLETLGGLLARPTILDGEVRLADIGSRPDFAVRVAGAVVGYIEVKKADLSLEPSTFNRVNLEQWERLKGLPNLVYTNGSDWRLYRGGELTASARLEGGPLSTAGSGLLTHGDDFRDLIFALLDWRPVPIRSVARLVATIAPLTRMLRAKVREQILAEAALVAQGADPDTQQFTGLASDWRALLFPDASDDSFADGYAQTVTFALLLARTEGIDLERTSFHEIGGLLALGHSLMGRALQLLTDQVDGGFASSVELLARVISAVDWTSIRSNKDTYLHLYENFLEAYDPALRKATGTYYTPYQIVDEMVRLTGEVLVTRLGKAKGFLDASVTTIDPAMGTGTYLHSILEQAAETITATEGPGHVPGAVSELATRLIGFEKQLGSFAVAQLRTTDLLKSHNAHLPSGGLRMFVADTLSDPTAADQTIASSLGAISASRKAANVVKSSVPVTVVIGNPPYGAKAEGDGGWIESGSANASSGTQAQTVAPLDAFRLPGNGNTEFGLKNLYVYFWRWATWKVFESVPADGPGVVSFITSSGYFNGPGFRGMREYLRREASEGWIVDLTPEGKRPPQRSAIFAIETPVAIAIFVRRADNDRDVPAPIHYVALSGSREEKFDKLAALTLDASNTWIDARAEWIAPLTPGATEDWMQYPALDDLMPWRGPGIAANRAWVYSPSQEILQARWAKLVSERNYAKRSELFHETRDARLSDVPLRLPGADTRAVGGPFLTETGPMGEAVRVGFRSFDRQWIVPDARVLHAPSPPLWTARVPDQVFMGEQHSIAVDAGTVPISFSAFIPDLNYTDNRAGRTLPLYHPDGTGNFAPGLLAEISERVGRTVTPEDMLLYIAAIVAHRGYSEVFAGELRTPGVRIPITTEAALWETSRKLGERVVWLQTYGARFADPDDGRPKDDPRFGVDAVNRVLSLEAVREMPKGIFYDELQSTIFFTAGDDTRNGMWGPVEKAVFEYKVGNLPIVASWLKYRSAAPPGRRSSPLDDILTTSWPASWTTEFTDLLTVLTRLIALESEQVSLLAAVVNGDSMTRTDFAGAGVVWPTTPRERRPHRAVIAVTNTPELVGFDDL